MNQTESKKQDIEKFLSDAFCVDGSVNMVSDEFITSLGKCHVGWFELTDSKRGTVYVGLLKQVKDK